MQRFRMTDISLRVGRPGQDLLAQDNTGRRSVDLGLNRACAERNRRLIVKVDRRTGNEGGDVIGGTQSIEVNANGDAAEGMRRNKVLGFRLISNSRTP